ncbi:MAG: hypothetical protein WBY12_09955 [Hyphomicrobium sp.]
MFVHLRMGLTLLSADTAGHCASFQRNADHPLVRARPAACDLSRGLANVGAIKVKPNTLREFENLLLTQARVCTRNAGLRTIETLFDAADEGLVGRAFDVWMGADHLLNMHGTSPG